MGRTSLQATAFHEAGHALADHVLGFNIKLVTIEPGEGYAGRVSGKLGVRPRQLEYRNLGRIAVARWHDKIVSLLAGREAQRRFNPRTLRRYMSQQDHEFAVDILLRLHPENEIAAVVKWLEICTQNLVGHPIRWKQIGDLAKALIERKTLSGEEVKAIFVASYKQQAADANSPSTLM